SSVGPESSWRPRTYLALAAPIWQFRSFGDWVAFLLGSLLGLFAGIGLRRPDVRLAWSGDLPGRRALRAGESQPRPCLGQVGDHAQSGHSVGLLCGPEREEADRGD